VYNEKNMYLERERSSFMNDPSKEGADVELALFAPLPDPFVAHLCELLALPLPVLAQQVRVYRSAVATYMEPIVLAEQANRRGRQAVRSQAPNIDTGWLLASLAHSSPTRRRIPLPTLSDWHKRGLLRYRSWGYPDVHSAAALLLMRMLCPQARGWLPSTMAEEEPQWWCWRQDGPEHPVLPCPYPLPPDLPDAALLWTHWRGAAWDEDWVPIGNRGAIRWATLKPGARQCWKLSLEQLALWDATVKALHLPLSWSSYGGKETEEQFVHVLATTALYRLAQGRLVSTT
jgi:hypothetical protein